MLTKLFVIILFILFLLIMGNVFAFYLKKIRHTVSEEIDNPLTKHGVMHSEQENRKQNTIQCPYCGANHIKTSAAFIICWNCGKSFAPGEEGCEDTTKK